MSSDSLARFARTLARTLAQQNLRGIWEKYYPDAHAVLFLIDSNDIGRMDDARRCLHSVARNKDLDGAPLLVAVNKQDKLDEELRAADKPTLPQTLGAEKAANVFLRADMPSVADAVGLSGKPAVEVFTEVRARKNKF